MTAFERTSCDCPTCVACCTQQPGPLAPGDLDRIAAHLGQPLDAVLPMFWASPGAMVARAGVRRMYDGGTFYDPTSVDHDPATMKPHSDNYELYEVKESFTLEASQLEGVDNVVQLLLQIGAARQVGDA